MINRCLDATLKSIVILKLVQPTLHAAGGQKFHDITDIPDELMITATEQTADLVEVTYAPGQHRSAFSRRWLRTPTIPTATRCRPCSCCTA
jgi:hypothetical protein